MKNKPVNTTMQGYQFQPGDRPLKGYTIQAVAGRGGFGEVYYAVSDSGREVALKHVTGHTDIELRGISHCMNLKSPHLVSIFDVVHNDAGDPFVVMEFIEGPSLRSIMDAPGSTPRSGSGASAGGTSGGASGGGGGIGTAKAAYFLREIAKGLSYLHDCGIVHRDLKPANIFYENGYVKIGDYGLSKAMSASVNQSHTVTVGSVHYMAPEVGAGKYDRSIDIYALGCLLYEMLTGITPFLGQSPAEILMKHLSGEPDMTGIEEPFARIIQKAMAKEPEDRYPTVQAMVEDLFGAEHVKQSVSSFNDADLSVYAERLQSKLAAGDVASTETVERVDRRVDEPSPIPNGSNESKPSASAVCSLGDPRDPIRFAHRVFYATLAAVTIAGATAGLGDTVNRRVLFFAVLSAIASACAGLGIYAKHYAPKDRGKTEKRWGRNASVALFMGAVACLFLCARTGLPAPSLQALWAGLLAASMANLTAIIRPARGERFRLAPVMVAMVTAAGFAFAASVIGILSHHVAFVPAIGLAAGLTLVPQIMFAWVPPHLRASTARASETVSSPAPHAARPAPAFATAATTDDVSSEPKPLDAPSLKAPQVTAPNPLIQPDGRVASSRNRTIALVLTGFPILGFPICGLQRFYAGKIVTGLLWLFTLGLLGIGQLIDFIILLAGEFKDANERPIRFWGAAPAGAASQPASAKGPARGAPVGLTAKPQPQEPVSVYREAGFDFLSLVLMVIASVMVMLGLMTATTTGLHLPEALAAGVFGQDPMNEINHAFGYNEWGSLVLMILKSVSFGLLITGGLLGVWARRRHDAMHIVRGLLAGTGFVIVAAIINAWIPGQWWVEGEQISLQRGLERIAAEVNAATPVLGLQRLMEAVDQPVFIFSAIFFTASVLLLVWPPRRPKPRDGRLVTG